MKLIDLSQQLQHGSLSYPGKASGLSIERLELDIEGMTLSTLSPLDPHCGTHFDAPLHFVPDADDIASSPLRLPEIVLVIAKPGPIPPEVLSELGVLAGKAVLFSTGWERNAGTKAYFSAFPTLCAELAEQLVAQDVALVGLDSPSVDPENVGYPAHRTLLAAGIPIVEGLMNLRILLPLIEAGRRVWLAAFPLRIGQLEASPVRAVAIVE